MRRFGGNPNSGSDFDAWGLEGEEYEKSEEKRRTGGLEEGRESGREGGMEGWRVEGRKGLKEGNEGLEFTGMEARYTKQVRLRRCYRPVTISLDSASPKLLTFDAIAGRASMPRSS